MKKRRKMIVATVLIAVLVLSLGIISYAAADSMELSDDDYDVPLDISVSSSGFTGTNLNHRVHTGASYQSWLESSYNRPYLTWQSQWKNVSTGYRYNGFSSWGSIINGKVYKTYRSPYCSYDYPFILKINNSSPTNSSYTVVGTWRP